MIPPHVCPFCRRQSSYVGVSLWVTGTACPCERLHVGPSRGNEWVLAQSFFSFMTRPGGRIIARLDGGPIRVADIVGPEPVMSSWTRGVDVPPAEVPAAVESVVREASVLEVMSS